MRRSLPAVLVVLSLLATGCGAQSGSAVEAASRTTAPVAAESPAPTSG
ncbi:hypothetical protein [Modestobacter marinus]|nr:hypothetical protein [Modestobacter marinus]